MRHRISLALNLSFTLSNMALPNHNNRVPPEIPKSAAQQPRQTNQKGAYQ
jgi:hypothetical protein